MGWKVENYGTDPDIDVDIAPHEFRQGTDTQLNRGIASCLKRGPCSVRCPKTIRVKRDIRSG